MLSYERLSPGSGFKPGRALLYYAQRAVTLPRPRRVVSSMIAAGVRARHGRSGATQSPAYAQALRALRRDGVAMLPPLADEATLDAMVAYFEQQPIVGPNGREIALRDLPQGGVAAYSLQRVLNCPGMIGLLNSDAILGLAADYLGCDPTLSSAGVRWSFPGKGSLSRTQNYHRDLDDWRFLKLFVYLTDVDEGSGPHCYIRGSHRTAFGLTAKAYAEAQLADRFGADSAIVVTGPRGSTFVADTIGIHRGQAPTERPRLLLQVQYSLLPIYAFHYDPVETTDAAAERYCNRLVLRGPDVRRAPEDGAAREAAAACET